MSGCVSGNMYPRNTAYCCRAPNNAFASNRCRLGINVTGAACHCAPHLWLASCLHEQTRMCTSRKDHKSFLGLTECRVPGVWAPPAQYCLGTMRPFVRTASWAVSPHVFSALYLHKMGACPGQGSWIQAAEDCPHRQVQSARDVPELRKQV